MAERIAEVRGLAEQYMFLECRLERKGYITVVSFAVAGEPHRFEVMERGSAAVILPIDAARRELFMVEQPRYTRAFVNTPGASAAFVQATQGASSGEFQVAGSAVHALELPAGMIDDGETPLETAIRELKEETGFVVARESLKYVGTVYSSSGISTERLFLYIAFLPESAARIEPNGDDSERFVIWKLSWDEAFDLMRRAHIENGASSILLRELRIMELEGSFTK